MRVREDGLNSRFRRKLTTFLESVRSGLKEVLGWSQMARIFETGVCSTGHWSGFYYAQCRSSPLLMAFVEVFACVTLVSGDDIGLFVENLRNQFE